jgi:uncharacterized protein YheU (UPF0270 family)
MPTHIEVPASSLSAEALSGLVDEFITREGTDYGEREHSLDHKRESVMRQLARNEVAIVFDFESESTTLLSRRELNALSLAAEQSHVARDD